MSTYPFAAIVGQDDLKHALLLNAVDPAVGGVLVRGQKGTAKSTAVRAVAALLPDIEVVAGDAFQRGPDEVDDDQRVPPLPADVEVVTRPTPLVELPIGASEDRLVGSLDLERALVDGVRAFEPGLLAAAHRGVLYVDEVNLLTDHLVDLLLDVAAMGTNHVEREGVSVRHPSRFLLVGTMNPEEGELRPQLLDRFGLTVTVAAPRDGRSRAEVVRRRLAFDADPSTFVRRWEQEEAELASRVVTAQQRLPDVELSDGMLARIAHVCGRFEVDGLRADLVIARAARANAAWVGRDEVALDDVRVAARLALPHRRRRGPLEQPGLDEDELERALTEPLDPEDDPDDPDDPGGTDPDGGPEGGSDDGEGPGQGRDGGPEPGPDEGRSGRGSDGRPDGGSGAGSGGGPPQEPSRAQGDPGPEGGGSRGEVSGEVDYTAEATDEPPQEDDTEQPGTVHRIGASGSPPLLVVPGRGRGDRGRRSASIGDHGAVVAARPLRPGEPARDLSPGATLRAAAPRQHARGRDSRRLVVRRDDLRSRVRQGREGNLVVFVVDASSSMGARRRMEAVKGAIRSLLLDAYQRRDRLALVTFRGREGQVVLPPTSSIDVADHRLATLPVGGRTPLAAGLARAGELVAANAAREAARRPLLVVLTDGRANVGGPNPAEQAYAQARGLADQGVAAVVVDTEDGFVRLGLADRLADHLAAPVLRLDDLGAPALAQVVRTAVGRAIA